MRFHYRKEKKEAVHCIECAKDMTLKAIGFDLFGTLLQAVGNRTTGLENLYEALSNNGIRAPRDSFFEIYEKVHSGFNVVRTTTCKEISNRVEVSETLRRLGHKLSSEASPIVEAVEAYFSCWTVKPFEGVEAVLRNLGGRFSIGVVTNFTDNVFVSKCLSELKLVELLDCVVISVEVGWRKPSPKIFQRFIQRTKAERGDTLFVGDDVASDVGGAKAVGFKTALLNRESNNKEAKYVVQPDFTLFSIMELEGVVDYINRR